MTAVGKDFRTSDLKTVVPGTSYQPIRFCIVLSAALTQDPVLEITCGANVHRQVCYNSVSLRNKSLLITHTKASPDTGAVRAKISSKSAQFAGLTFCCYTRYA